MARHQTQPFQALAPRLIEGMARSDRPGRARREWIPDKVPGGELPVVGEDPGFRRSRAGKQGRPDRWKQLAGWLIRNAPCQRPLVRSFPPLGRPKVAVTTARLSAMVSSSPRSAPGSPTRKGAPSRIQVARAR